MKIIDADICANGLIKVTLCWGKANGKEEKCDSYEWACHMVGQIFK